MADETETEEMDDEALAAEWAAAEEGDDAPDDDAVAAGEPIIRFCKCNFSGRYET